MALNAGLSIQRCTNTLMEIIERESAKGADWWKREHEAQRQEIQQLAQDRDRALMEAHKAREETLSYRAEMERYKNGMDCQWSAEIGRLQKEVQSWKSKYELAARRQNEVQQRLVATHARFSHTIIPVEEDGMTHASVPATPTKLDTPPVAETPFRGGSPHSVYSPANKRRRYQTTIMFPTPALAAAAAEKTMPSARTANAPIVEPTSKTREPVAFNARLLAKYPSDGIAPSATLIAAPTNIPRNVDTHPNPDSPGHHPQTSDNKKQWCYCGRFEYGAMIMCSDLTCTKQWFHVPCTGLEHVPEGDWFCNLCAPPDSNVSAARPLSDTHTDGIDRS